MPHAPDAVATEPSAWEQRYRSGATGWDRGAPSPALQHWIAHGWLAGNRVLVPGCGRGHEVVMLAGLGYAVTAIDVAPSAVASLRGVLARRGLEARVIEADVLEWSDDRPFDAIYEQTCLCALAPALWEIYAGRLHGWLAPGGRLLASFMQTHRAGGPPFHCDPGAMRALFAAPRWHWLRDDPLHVAHSPGLAETAFPIERRAGTAA